MSDSLGWDRYWQNHFELEQGLAFLDLFVDDRELVAAIRRRGGSNVLCVGNGVSREPFGLAATGLNVTALDLSSLATETIRRIGSKLSPEDLEQYIDAEQRQPGGEVEFEVGDLLDPEVCPGPFDVIVERRTIQLFGEALPQALEALVGRLASNGILYTHCHDGSWRPPRKRHHASESWLRAQKGFSLHQGGELKTTSGKVAWLMMTTG